MISRPDLSVLISDIEKQKLNNHPNQLETFFIEK